MGDEVEGGVPRCDDCDGGGEEGFAVEEGEVALFSQGLEGCRDDGVEGVAVGLEVYEEDEGLRGVLLEDAV